LLLSFDEIETAHRLAPSHCDRDWRSGEHGLKEIGEEEKSPQGND